MSWELDPTEDTISARSRWYRYHTLGVVLLVSVLLGSLLGVWYWDHHSPLAVGYVTTPSRPESSVSNSTPISLPTVSPLTAAADVPLVPFDVVVRPTVATITIGLPPPPSKLYGDIAGITAQPTYQWRVLIPTRGPNYYALGVTLEMHASGDAIASPAGLWYHDRRMVMAVGGPAVVVAVRAGYLVMTMRDPALIAQVFGQHPSIVTVEGASSEALPLTTVVVRYDDRDVASPTIGHTQPS